MNSWRDSRATLPSGLNFALAIWIIISPWVLNFAGGNAAPNALGVNNGYWGMVWNLVISGAVILVFSGIRLWGSNTLSSLSWINAAIGVWIFISPWVFGDSNVSSILWNCVICGAVVFLLGAWSALITDRATI